MKRSILEQSWAVAKPRHAGAAYNRRARTVALVTSWREEVGSPWALSIRTAYRDLEQEPRVSVRWGPTLRSPLRTKPRTGRTLTRETLGWEEGVKPGPPMYDKFTGFINIYVSPITGSQDSDSALIRS